MAIIYGVFSASDLITPPTVAIVDSQLSIFASGFILQVSILTFFFGHTAIQDLSSLTSDQTQATAVKASSPNHWTARELLNRLLKSRKCHHYIWGFFFKGITQDCI